MPRAATRLLVGILCLSTSAVWASKSRTRPSAPASAPAPASASARATSAPATTTAPASARAPAPEARAADPRPAESLHRAPASHLVSVEGFLGGLFLLSHPSADIPGVGTVEASAPPVFRWGARLSSPFYRLNPAASLEWVATLGLNHTGQSQQFLGMTLSSSTLALDVLPGLRARFLVLPKLSLTGELGVGVQFSRTSVQMTFAGEKVQGATAGVFRLALGGQYEVTDALGIYFEPLAIHEYVGQGSVAGWSLQAGIAYAL